MIICGITQQETLKINMKKLIILFLTTIGTYCQAQEFTIIIEYSTGDKDSVVFGFSDDATLGIDSEYNEVNIYGLPLQPFELRTIQRVLDVDSDCTYENIYSENIDAKIDIR